MPPPTGMRRVRRPGGGGIGGASGPRPSFAPNRASGSNSAGGGIGNGQYSGKKAPPAELFKGHAASTAGAGDRMSLMDKLLQVDEGSRANSAIGSSGGSKVSSGTLSKQKLRTNLMPGNTATNFTATNITATNITGNIDSTVGDKIGDKIGDNSGGIDGIVDGILDGIKPGTAAGKSSASSGPTGPAPPSARPSLMRQVAGSIPGPWKHSKRTMAMVHNAFSPPPKILKPVITTVLTCTKNKPPLSSSQPPNQPPLSADSKLSSTLKLRAATLLLLLFFFGFLALRRTNLSSPLLRSPAKLSSSSSSSALFSPIVHQAVFPPHLDHLANLTQTYDPKHETPYFWDVHFSGESVAEAIFGQCHFLTMACEFGLRHKDFNEEKLELFYLEGVRYVNVDTTTADGIQRASKLKLADTRLANIIISPHVHEMSARIFHPQHKGRMFTLFRHPLDRALAMYHYLSKASWDPMYNPAIAQMTIEQYASSPHMENNWMTRFLVQKPRGKLLPKDMLLAKKIVQFKVLVGLYDDMEESMVRFQRYFGWNQGDSQNRLEEIPKCRKAFIQHGDRAILENHGDTKKALLGSDGNKNNIDGLIQQGNGNTNKGLDMIKKQNQFDLELFQFAKKIYKIQGEQIFNMPS